MSGYLDPKEGPECEKCPLFEAGIPVADYWPHEFSGLSLVGEMPGYREVQLKHCFVGPTGKLLDAALQFSSLTRQDIHLTNIIRCGLPRGGKPEDHLQKEAARCCKGLLYNNLRYIGTTTACAVGAVAWEALTGLLGIDKYRGVVIPSTSTIPWHTGATIHPAGLLKVEARRLRVSLLIADLAKYYRLAKGEEAIWDPTVKDPHEFEELCHFLQNDRVGPTAVDVETTSIDALEADLLTIGVAARNRKTGEIEAWPIPYHPNFPGFYTEEQWGVLEQLLLALLSTQKQPVVFHNMTYDIPVLENYFGDGVAASAHDTLLLHHAAYPKLPHDLQGVASQFLCVEPWKSQFHASEKLTEKVVEALNEGYVVHINFADGETLNVREEGTIDEEGKDLDDTRRVIRNVQDLNDLETGELLYYNALDSAATLELFAILTEEARNLDVLEVYNQDRELVRETVNWYYCGIAIDEPLRRRLEVEFADELDTLLEQIRGLCELPPREQIEERSAEPRGELEELEREYRDVRLCCLWCDYVGKDAPSHCRHIVAQHEEYAKALADEQKLDYRGTRNSKEQDKLLYQAVREWQKSDLEQLNTQIKATKEVIKKVNKLPCRETFNPASPKQLLEALRCRGLTPTKLTAKSGELSTSKDSLWPLRDDPFVDLLFRYRGKAKLFSTYIVGLPEKLGADGRLHPVWKLHSTPSGRFGTKPAVQNWPSSMKKMIVPDPGHVIVAADFGAVELRSSALLSGQEDLIEAFIHEVDIHAKHAGIFFPTVWPEVDREWFEAADTDQERDIIVPARSKLRGRGKSVTFGKIYRAGPKVLYEQVREELEDVRTPEEHRRLLREVAAMSAALDNAYPNIPRWADAMAKEAEETLMLRTAISGRIRKWPMGEVPPTEAANHPIQGLAADIMNAATLRLIGLLKGRGIHRNGAWIIMQIHDAIYLEVEERYAVEVAAMVEKAMYTELTLPSVVTGKDHHMIFPAEAEIGYNAQELYSVKKWVEEKEKSHAVYAPKKNPRASHVENLYLQGG